MENLLLLMILAHSVGAPDVANPMEEPISAAASLEIQMIDPQTVAAKPNVLAGSLEDQDLGVFYHGARFYTGAIGRFVEVDPQRQFINTYSYVANNPVGATDATGEFTDFYSTDGEWLGSDGVDNNQAFAVNPLAFIQHIIMGKNNWSALFDDARNVNLGDHDRLLEMAATNMGEASERVVVPQESLALGSVQMRVDFEGLSTAMYGSGSEVYDAFMAMTPTERNQSDRARYALWGAVNAVLGGIDYSRGAYFWDGRDLQPPCMTRSCSGYVFINPDHNIFQLPNMTYEPIVKYYVLPNGKQGGKRGAYSYIYESTAAHGETVFWRYSDDYMKATGTKQGH